jgi:hypothetical protein
MVNAALCGVFFADHTREGSPDMEPVNQTEEKRVGQGKPGPGRPKGSVNKVGRAAKEVIAQAAQDLGGVDRLVEWARESPKNEAAFWSSIYPKLVPLENYVSGPDGGPVESVMEVVFRDAVASRVPE